MSQPDWNVVQALYNELLPLPPDKQKQVLREQCEGDQALFDEVWSLLQAGKEASQFLRQSADTLFAQELEPGTTIGAYRLIRPLGRGGSGTVYLAWQRSETVERLVAIKVLRPGLDDEATRERFSLEQQVLADLQHPHIARLYDAGVTAGGRPYAVMEYVDGLPLDTFCAERTLSLHERLSLFIQVCDAVQYAHSKLVLHRDLKPSNIFVTQEEGGPPRVQLLDFGLAKLLDPEHRADLTATQERALTPHYASPEQVRGAPVSTATDVYSLGVVLYELLTGAKPLDLSDASPMSWERIIAEENPTLPSKKAASQADDDTQTHAPSALEGDLDNIVLKALRKEPARRYESVRALADDIERHLKGHPVEAREPTWRYRTSRFVTRNRTAVTAALVAALFLIGGASAALWQAGVAAAERDRAQTEQARATATLDLFIEVVGAANPSAGENADVTVREVADETFAQVMEGNITDEGTRRHLAEAVGRLYKHLGAYEQALETLDLALQTTEEMYGPHSPEVARALYESAQALLYLARYDSAEARLFRAKAIVERHDAPPDDPRWLSIYQSLAAAYVGEGSVQKAEDVLRAGLSLAETYPGIHDPMKTSLLANLANVNHMKRDFDSAIEGHRQVLALLEQEDAPQYHNRINTKQNLSQALQNKADEQTDEQRTAELLAEASHWLDDAMDISEQVFGRTHPQTASLMHRRGILFRSAGDTTQALTSLNDALEIQRSVLPENHRATAFTLNAIGTTFRDIGKLEEARPYLKESLDMLMTVLPAEGGVIGSARLGLAKALLEMGEYVQAEDHLLQARTIFEDQFGVQDSRFVETAEYLALLYEALDKPEREAHFRALARPGD